MNAMVVENKKTLGKVQIKEECKRAKYIRTVVVGREERLFASMLVVSGGRKTF